MANTAADLRTSAVFFKVNSIEIACRSRFAFASIYNKFNLTNCAESHGVMVSTLDSESSDLSSNLGGTWINNIIFHFSIYYSFRFFSFP